MDKSLLSTFENNPYTKSIMCGAKFLKNLNYIIYII